MDIAPWELGVSEKSKPKKLNTVGMRCQRKVIAW